jgi:hypothetical protein
MNRYLICSFLYLTLATIGVAQQIQLRQIYSKAIRPDCIRFEYVFSAKNNSRHRLNLVGTAILLDAQMNPLDQRFVSFETPAGQTSDCSIESDHAPVYFDEIPGKTFYFRLKLQDNALRKPLEIDGTIKAPISRKEGY